MQKIYSVNDYIKHMRETRQAQLIETYKKDYCSSPGYKKGSWKSHVGTKPYKRAIRGILADDTEYQKYADADAPQNPRIIQEYEQYKEEEKKKAKAIKAATKAGRMTDTDVIDGWIQKNNLSGEIIKKIKEAIVGSGPKTSGFLPATELTGYLKKDAHSPWIFENTKNEVLSVIFHKDLFKEHILSAYRPAKLISSVLKRTIPEYADNLKNPYFSPKGLECPSKLKIMDEAAETLSGKTWLELLLGNEAESESARYLLELVEEKEALERLSANILDRIPDDLVDLYPLARSMSRHFIIHAGPTNSGKTHDSIERFLEAEKGIYLAPLRLLACEIYERANGRGVPCTLKTGEETEEVVGATHQSSTVEMLDTVSYYDVAVVDECQMIDDEERGGGWTSAVLGLCAKEIHLCTAPHAVGILTELIKRGGDSYEIVEHKRQTELIVEKNKFSFPRDVQKGDALIVFSKKGVLHRAQELKRNGYGVSVIYGSLPYHVRKNEVQRFVSNETQVVVATDAIGMGMNLPVKRIVFLELEKFDGKTKRPIFPKELQQIAGRAGRRGMFDTGYVTSEFQRRFVRKSLEAEITEINTARLGFPPQLIGLEGKTSSILETWMNTVNSDPLFVKAELDEQISLAKELELISDNKELIFRFVFIPFNTNDENLKYEWRKLFKEEARGRHGRFAHQYVNSDNLNSMEYAHAYCDMLFFYTERFNPENEVQKAAIKEEKSRIEDMLIKYLKDHDLPVKKCKYCKKPLPWNYPYGMCERCHGALYGGWDYDF